jgi:alpha-ribazole phosphatase CobZ
MDLLSLLERKGVTMEDLWAMARELPRSETSQDLGDLRRGFVEELEKIKEDANVNALVQAAMLVDSEGDRDNIRGLRAGEFRNDPAHLVADKMLGANLVDYLAGKEELSEYHRYIGWGANATKRLGPFLDDVVLALVWGTMSRTCGEHPGKSGSSTP